MNRTALVVFPAFLFLLNAFAFAQGGKIGTDDKNRAETAMVTVSGQVNIDGVFRDRNLVAIREGVNDDMWTAEGYARLRLDVQLSENIEAVVSLRNQRLTSGATFRFGANEEQTPIIVDQATITVNQLFTPALKLDLGIVPVAFDIRGKGSAMFFDPAHSSTFGRQAVVGGMDFGTFEDELQPTGLHGTYAGDAWKLGVFLLPAVIEGGRASDDESAYGIWLMYNLSSIGEGSQIGAMLALNHVETPGVDSRIFTIGAGITWHGLTEGLELFFEGYAQFGQVDDTVDASAFAIQLGGLYQFETDIKPWVGLTFTFFSGGDDSSDVENFMSYENINDLLVLEDQWFGLDVDTNYLSVKLMGGAAFTVGSGQLPNNLELSLVVGFNKLVEDVTGPLVPGGNMAYGSGSDDIGHEVDINLKLWASKQVAFYTRLGALFGSDVLEDEVGTEDSRAFVWVAGTDLRF